MKLIVDIPEQMYLIAKADMLCGGELLVKAIKNGKPLTENKGEWVRNIHDKIICSRCGAERTQWYDDDSFCSHCGADMRKEQT